MAGNLKISPPFTLHHRWKPIKQAQCYMMGRVEGQYDNQRIITNISAKMHPEFDVLMGVIKKEADAGAFATKDDAVRRRNEIIKKGAQLISENDALS